ncbi:MAG TPA: glycosyltransferase family 2 protein [Gemmatimonadaceae bacterium]|nr:glycosyltransferase family 2 protein [Gemmatimonadaceae bacterium]
MSSLLPILCAAPWILAPVVTLVRGRRSRSLDEQPAEVSGEAPLVSLVIPARNEAQNIRRCVTSALGSGYPNLEVVVVDDHSTDGTGAIVAELAAQDARLRVVTPAALPDGWFGKQWACTAGAEVARGEILGFFDADTWQSPDLVPRAVNAMRARDSDMLTVAGEQEMGSFWEKLVQPQVFAVLGARFGGTEVVNESRHVSNKIANGQCMFFRRDAYDAMGGHGAVREKVAEDLAFAQHWFLAGRRVTMVLGLAQLSTRMYTSLRELVEGWGKNIYAGGRDAAPGALGRAIFPVLLLLPGLSGVLPPILLALGALGVVGNGLFVWAAIVTGVNLVWWLAVYLALGMSPLYALAHPLGAGALLYISVRALVRGRQVRWKGRDYRVA